jgi:hypothetical protein
MSLPPDGRIFTEKTPERTMYSRILEPISTAIATHGGENETCITQFATIVTGTVPLREPTT